MNTADALTIIVLVVIGFALMAICHSQSKRIDELRGENRSLYTQNSNLQDKLTSELVRSLNQAREHERCIVELLKKLEETK